MPSLMGYFLLLLPPNRTKLKIKNPILTANLSRTIPNNSNSKTRKVAHNNADQLVHPRKVVGNKSPETKSLDEFEF